MWDTFLTCLKWAIPGYVVYYIVRLLLNVRIKLQAANAKHAAERLKWDQIAAAEKQKAIMEEAARGDKSKDFKTALDNGADPTALIDDRTGNVLCLAAAHNAHACIRILLPAPGTGGGGGGKSLVDPTEVVPFTKRMPIHIAACKGHRAALLKLLLGGAPVDALTQHRDDHDRTALQLVFFARPTPVDNWREIAWTLIRHGAKVNARDNTGRTALHGAADSFGDRAAMVRFLLEHGADPTIQSIDDKKETAAAQTADGPTKMMLRRPLITNIGLGSTIVDGVTKWLRFLGGDPEEDTTSAPAISLSTKKVISRHFLNIAEEYEDYEEKDLVDALLPISNHVDFLKTFGGDTPPLTLRSIFEKQGKQQTELSKEEEEAFADELAALARLLAEETKDLGSALLKAVDRLDVKATNRLLLLGANPNTSSGMMGTLPLNLALKNGQNNDDSAFTPQQKSCAKLLIDFGATPSADGGDGRSALWSSVTSPEKTRFLLEYAGLCGADNHSCTDPFTKNTPLHLVVMKIPDFNNSSALKYSDEARKRLVDRQVEVARLLVDSGMDPTVKGEKGMTALEMAQEKGSGCEAMVELLAKK